MPYEAWLKANAPPYLQDQYGQAWMGGIGATLDDYVQQFIAGVKAAFPNQAPTDALAVLGAEIGIDRGPTETDAQYGARLAGAWSAWQFAGTPLGILVALYWAGFQGAVTAQQNGLAYNLSGDLVAGADPTPMLAITTCSALIADLTPASPATKTIPAANPWWKLDGNNDFCSRFAVLFPSPGITPSATDLARMQSAIKKWKPGKATCTGIYSVTAGVTFGWPVRTFADAATAPSAVTFYSAT